SSFEIWHAARESGGDRKPTGIGMVFHVVLRRMGEHDARFHFADRGGQLAKGCQIVENLQIISDALVTGGAEKLRGGSGFLSANFAHGGGAEPRAPAVAAAEGHIMDVPTV